MRTISFWFSIGSTYTYLTIMRLAEVAQRTGARFEWRPFSLRAITREMNNIPFATKPIKARYMWRDIERRAERYGFKARVPAPYPLKELDRANRVAIVGREEGWCDAYATETYMRWFLDGQPPGEEPNLSSSLTAIGQQTRAHHRPCRRTGDRGQVQGGDGRGTRARDLWCAYIRGRPGAVLGR